MPLHHGKHEKNTWISFWVLVGLWGLKLLTFRTGMWVLIRPVIAAKAPAIQLCEHAQAILADDREIGVIRSDPVLQRMAGGSTHAATKLH